MNYKKVIKRLLTISIVLLVAYFNLNFYLNYQINRELNRIKSEGEIIDLSEMKGNYICKDNRATLYIAAGEIINFDNYSSENPITYYEKHEQEICAAFDENKTVLEIMEIAMTKSKCNFHLDYEKGVEMIIPNFCQLRKVAHLLSAKAIEDIKNENYPQAVERITQCLIMGKDFCNSKGGVTTHMMGINFINVASESLNYMIENKIKTDYSSVIKVMNEIKSSGNENLIKSLEIERACGIDCYKNIFLQGKLIVDSSNQENIHVFSRYSRFILRPYMLADELYYIKYTSRILDKIQNFPKEEVKQEAVSDHYIFSSLVVFNMEKAFLRHQEVLNNCRKLTAELMEI